MIKEKEIYESEYGEVSNSKKRKLNVINEEEEEEEVIKDARSRQFYDPSNRTFNYTKRRVTDLEENKYVKLPKATDERMESELAMLKKVVLGEFRKYKNELDKEEEKSGVEKEKRKNQELKNLKMI